MTWLLLGLAAMWLTTAVRAVPPFKAWTQAGRKPWACQLCMSLWSTLALVLALVVSHVAMAWLHGALTWRWALDGVLGSWLDGLAGAGVCFMLLKVLDSLKPPPPVLPNAF